MAINPTNPYEGMSNEELRARIARNKAEIGQPTEQQKRNETVIKQAETTVAQSMQRNADLIRQLNQYRQRSQQEEQRLATQRTETQKFKENLKTKTAADVKAIESGAVVPGSSEWDSIIQGAIDSTTKIKPARAKIEAEKIHSYNNPFLEETVKPAVKDSIVQQFMENAKFAARGAEKQRPKSWNKGVKSGSEKRKMREEGKRESKEMNESKGGQNVFRPEPGGVGAAMDKSLADAVNVFSGEGVSIPKTITPRVADILRKEMAWRQNMDQYITRGQSGVGNVAPGSMVGEPIKENKLYYTKLKEAAQSWGPEVAGAAQDDATAAAYEQESREKDVNTSKKMSHADVIEKLNQAHETALSRIATSFSKGGKHHGQDPYYMLGHYMEHLEDLHDPIRQDLT